MIWLKRIAPFLLIAVLYFGYNNYQKQQVEQKLADEKRYALVTAQAWVGSMTYRDDPELYLAYRDSLLEEHNLSNDSLKMFIESYESQAEDLVQMSAYIKANVDSILHVMDSLKIISDSLAVVDSLISVDSLK